MTRRWPCSAEGGRHDPHRLHLTKQTDFWTNDFPPELNVRYLRPIPRRYSFLPFAFAKKRIRYDFPAGVEYDLAADFNSYQVSCAVGALTVPAKKRVMWIHNDVRVKLQNEWKYRVLWHFFKGKFKKKDLEKMIKVVDTPHNVW